jgi:hypothetical protein
MRSVQTHGAATSRSSSTVCGPDDRIDVFLPCLDVRDRAFVGRTTCVNDQAPNAAVNDWLAAATGAAPEAVAAEIELGDRRRGFVAEELLDAGFRGTLLVELVMRLTGTDEAGAAALVDARIDAQHRGRRRRASPGFSGRGEGTTHGSEKREGLG